MVKKVKNKYVLLFIAAMVLFSITAIVPLNVNSEVEKQILPLSIGNNWLYLSPDGSSPSYEFHVNDKKSINNKLYYSLHIKTSSTQKLEWSENYKLFIRNETKGLYLVGADGTMNTQTYTIGDEEVLAFKYPTKVGDKSKGFHNEAFITMNVKEVVKFGQNESCESVLYLNSRPNNDYSMIWLCPGIGMVKEVGEIKGHKFTLILSKYSIKK